MSKHPIPAIMVGNPTDSHDEMSRRNFLQRILEASAAGAGMAAVSAAPALAHCLPYLAVQPSPYDAYAYYQYRRAFGTMPKYFAAYMDYPNGWQHCGICTHFIPLNACDLVQPPVSHHGWCRFFRHRRGMGGY